MSFKLPDYRGKFCRVDIPFEPINLENEIKEYIRSLETPMENPLKSILLEIGLEMAQGLHDAGIIDDQQLEEFKEIAKDE